MGMFSSFVMTMNGMSKPKRREASSRDAATDEATESELNKGET
jgi:hypothetical protein